MFGRGSIEGVAASESANNGVTGATLIPLLTLGIPGDTVTAILLGAFMMKGITPGPSLIGNRPEIVYTIMFSTLVINLFMLLQGRFFVRVFAGGHGGVCADAAVGYAVVLFVPAVYFAVAVYFHPVATYAVGSEVAVLALQYCDMVVRHAYPAEFHAGNFGWRVHM